MLDRFPRGTLPPSTYQALEKRPMKPGATPRGTCDLAATCPTCGTLMQPEHAHYRCLTCGYRDSCCF